MVDYVQNVDFGDKDALTPGDPLKRIRGTEVDAELDEIATAIASKENTANKDQNSGYAGLDSSGKLAVAVIPAATDTAVGGVELATTAEVVTGTDTTRAVTAAGVEAWGAQNAGMVQDISNLSDPNADRILFWDDSAGAVVGLVVSTGLAISTTNITLSHLGIQSLTDPGADRILFWDDSAGATAWLSLGTGLTLSGTTLSIDTTATPSSYAVDTTTTLNLTAGTSMSLVATNGDILISTDTTDNNADINIDSGDGVLVTADTSIDLNSPTIQIGHGTNAVIIGTTTSTDLQINAPGATGGTAPANITGYFLATINGTLRKIPYYTNP